MLSPVTPGAGGAMEYVQRLVFTCGWLCLCIFKFPYSTPCMWVSIESHTEDPKQMCDMRVCQRRVGNISGKAVCLPWIWKFCQAPSVWFRENNLLSVPVQSFWKLSPVFVPSSSQDDCGGTEGRSQPPLIPVTMWHALSWGVDLSPMFHGAPVVPEPSDTQEAGHRGLSVLRSLSREVRN